MNTHWKWIALASTTSLALVLLLAATCVENQKPQPSKITGKTLIAVNELKWVPLPGIPGAEEALLLGDPAKEAHRVFFKYPVGLKAPLHTHTYGDRGVILSGVLSLAVDGAPAKKLPPGSYFSIGAGVPHLTTVEGNEPCVFFMERDGPFDVVMSDATSHK